MFSDKLEKAYSSWFQLTKKAALNRLRKLFEEKFLTAKPFLDLTKAVLREYAV